MKLVKRISLFMTLSVIMLGLGGWGALKAEEFFYPHRYRNSYEQAGTGSADSLRQSVSQLADAVSQSAPFSQDEQTGTAVKEQVIDRAAEEPVIEAAAAQEPVEIGRASCRERV